MFADRVLVLHYGALGDCVLALQFVLGMRRENPNAHISVAARSSVVHWAQRHGWINEALTPTAAVEALRSCVLHRPISEHGRKFFRSFGVVIDFGVWRGCGKSSNKTREQLSDIRGWKINCIAASENSSLSTLGMHIVDQWREQLTLQGLHLPSPTGTYHYPDLLAPNRSELRMKLVSSLGPSGGRTAIFHPGSGGLKKVLPLEEIERLAGVVRARGMRVSWMIGPDEMERDGESYIKQLSRTAPVIAEEDICKAADLVAGADEFIGFDAGMTHVAAMAGVPTTAIFGVTDPRVWRPLGPTVRVADFSNAVKVLAQGFAEPSDGGGSSFGEGGVAGFGAGAGAGAGAVAEFVAGAGEAGG